MAKLAEFGSPDKHVEITPSLANVAPALATTAQKIDECGQCWLDLGQCSAHLGNYGNNDWHDCGRDASSNVPHSDDAFPCSLARLKEVRCPSEASTHTALRAHRRRATHDARPLGALSNDENPFQARSSAKIRPTGAAYGGESRWRGPGRLRPTRAKRVPHVCPEFVPRVRPVLQKPLVSEPIGRTVRISRSVANLASFRCGAAHMPLPHRSRAAGLRPRIKCFPRLRELGPIVARV